MLNVVLVYLFLRALGLQTAVSLIAASIFAIHPVQVESVAWISERKLVLAFFFFFLSFLTYIRYSKLRTRSLYVLSVILFLLASLSKSAVVVLPLLLLSYDYFYGGERRSISIKDKIPYFIIASICSVFTIYGHSSRDVGIHIHGGTVVSHVISIFSMLTEYLRLVFYPVRLSTLYEPPVYTSILHPRPLIGLTTLVISFFFLCIFSRRRDNRGFWILWFFILMLPILHILPFLESYNDRYLYVSILSFPILLCGVISPHLIAKSTIRNISLVGVVIIIAMLSFLSYQRCKVWNNSFRLWQDAFKSAPNSYITHLCLGVVYERAGEYEKAIKEHKLSLRLRPDHSNTLASLGIAYQKAGFLEEAIDAELRAIDLDPKNKRAYNNLGVCYSKKGLYGKAVEAYSRALNIYPDYDKAYNNLSSAYFSQGAWDLAVDAAKKAILLKPNFAAAYNNLGNAYASKGNYKEALGAYERALEIDPTLESARKNLQTVTEHIETQTNYR